MMENCRQVRERLLAPILRSFARGAFAAARGISFRERTISQLCRILATASVWLTASTMPVTFSPLA